MLLQEVLINCGFHTPWVAHKIPSFKRHARCLVEHNFAIAAVRPTGERKRHILAVGVEIACSRFKVEMIMIAFCFPVFPFRSSLLVEAVEVEGVVLHVFNVTFSRFGLGTPVLARINNRKILNGLLEALGLADKAADIFDVVDHSEKVPLEVTEESLKELGLDDDAVAKLMAFCNLHGEREHVVGNLRGLGIENETFGMGVAELDKVLTILELDGYKGEIEADMKIVRGLDYYTGTVFEFILPEYKQIGSVCGGGRYENLTGYFAEQKFPGVGGSIGLTRLFYVLNENNLVKSQGGRPIDYALIPLTENELAYTFKVAKDLRAEGKSVMVVPGEKKLGDKMKYAAKIARFGVVLGESEVESGTYDVKEFD